jgi:hypothetical protein
MMRQVAGAFAEYEKNAACRKTRCGTAGASWKTRASVRAEEPVCSGSRSTSQDQRELETAGYLNECGRPYNPNSIKLMLES